MSANLADFHRHMFLSKLQSAALVDPLGGVGCGVGGGHPSSSAPSVQSFSPSHFQLLLIHKSSAEQ